MIFLLFLYELSPKRKRQELIARLKGMEDARRMRNELAAIKKPIYIPLSNT